MVSNPLILNGPDRDRTGDLLTARGSLGVDRRLWPLSDLMRFDQYQWAPGEGQHEGQMVQESPATSVNLQPKPSKKPSPPLNFLFPFASLSCVSVNAFRYFHNITHKGNHTK